MNFVLIVCMAIAFFSVVFLTPWGIKYLRRIKLVVKDQNKKDKPLVPISGGMMVLPGLFVGIMCFVFFNTFFPDGGILFLDEKVLMFLLSALISIMMITLIGFIDDLTIREDNEVSLGLKQWQKPLLTLAAAVPLVVINSGVSTLVIPFLGRVDVGLLYPLVFIPVGVVGAANMVNLLEGFNGMGSGMGIISIGMLSIYSYLNREELFLAERTSVTILSAIVFAALLAFYLYNKYPARILPGDSLTYLIGGTLASIAIIGNLEKVALIISIPFFIEVLLKLRGKFKKQSYGRYYKNGKVKSLYSKVYSLPHILTCTGKFTEKQVVYAMIGLELFFSSLIWIV